MVRRIVIVVVIGMAAVLGIPRHAFGGSTKGEIEAQISQGYDSNPLELNQEALPSWGEAPRGSFTQVGLKSRLAHQWTSRAGFFVAARGQGRFHPSYLGDAETAGGQAEAGLGFVLFARGERRLSASLRGTYGLERSTFVDPATGVVYFEFADPNAPTPIPDRFDVNVTGAHLDLRLRASRDLLLMLDSALERQDYVEPYDDVPTLEPLDDRTLAVRPGVRWQVTGRVRLDVTAEWSDRRYAGVSALDEEALQAEGERRRYRTLTLRTAVRLEPSPKWSVQAGLGGSDRQDLFAGYYDSTGSNAFVSAAWAVTETTRLGLHVTQAVFDYERATLDNLPNGDRRGGDVLRGAASVEKDLGGHLTVFGEVGALRSGNQDPLYAYDRNWAHAGLRYRL